MSDPEPEVTRDALATLTEELIARGDIAGELVAESPAWTAGRIRREIVFAIERAMVCAETADADGLRDAARRVAERDPDDAVFPGLAAALRSCAADLDAHLAPSSTSLAALVHSLAATPFAPAVARLPSR